MGKILLFFLIMPLCLRAQLTVEKIMQDPKWIGTSPSNIFWSYDSKSVYFKWNPEKKISDSSYNYFLSESKISKSSFNNAQFAEDIQDGKYNQLKTEKVFVHENDIYLLNIATGKVSRITQTEAAESDPLFTDNDSNIEC